MMSKEPFFTDDQAQLARFAKALGHPVRVYIMELLSCQPCCFSGDLAEILPIARSTLSQHLSELKEAGLIQGTIQAPKIKYCVNPENWAKARELFGELFGTTPVTDNSCITNPGLQAGDCSNVITNPGLQAGDCSNVITNPGLQAGGLMK